MTLFRLCTFSLVAFLLTSCGRKSTDENKTIQEIDSLTSKILPNKIEVKEGIENAIVQPEWAKNSIIYEINTRQFSDKGTLKKVTNQLARIRSLGVDVIWIMPIYPIGEKQRKGTLGNYYAVKDYKGINPEFGTDKDFKQLVDSAHTLGMKVLMDWEANYSSLDNVWVKEHLDYYKNDSLAKSPTETEGKYRNDVVSFDYANPKMRLAMTDAMKYWVKEFDIDGFRCDEAGSIPLDFWKENRKALDSIKPVFMLAEGTTPQLHEAFNMTYGTALKDTILDIAKGGKDFSAVHNYYEYKLENFKPSDLIMYFTTNHNENSWKYTEKEAFGKNIDNYVVLTYIMGGMPLIYNGQESGLKKRLKPYDRDTIDWLDYPKASFYKQLNALLKKNKVLWSNGEPAKFEVIKSGKDVFQFIRSKDGSMLAFLQNYSEKDQYVSKLYLNGFNLTRDILTGEEIPEDARGIVVPPHQTIVIGQTKE